MSVKVCGRDESNEQKGCVNGSYASVSLVRMPGGRPKGTSSMDHIMDKDSSSMEKNTNMNGLENVNGQEKMKEDQLEGETQKRMPVVDGNVLLQWGHRKRSRCSRLESKHGMDDSLPLPKKTTRVESRVVKVEKQSTVGMNHDTLRLCSRSPLEFGSSSGRRTGQDSTVPLKGISINNKNCMSNDIKQRHSFPSITEKPDTHASAHRISTVSACLMSTDNGESPDNIFDIVAVHGGGTGMKRIPFASNKVDLDSFEWPRIFVTLSRKEKEDDFYAIKGCKLPQRPKRRPKAVEKALHNCCPGNWLSDLTRGRYDVREKKCANKKKRRGLKAMESSDSDF